MMKPASTNTPEIKFPPIEFPQTSQQGAPASRSSTTSTKSEGRGQAMLVTNPLDLWYLCQKVRWAKKNPEIGKDGRHLYQRQVTRLILIDDEAFDYKFPYIAEVGFNMTTAVPTPIMSKNRPNYPSTFPLSQYKIIKKNSASTSYPNLDGRGNAYEFDVMSIEEGISKSKLETVLETVISNEVTTKPLGLLRIPDVIRIKDLNLEGKLRYQQENIDQVIEIKFGKDELSKLQQRAYEKIAGSRAKFRLLEDKQCDCKDCSRKWEAEAKREPAYFRAMLGTSHLQKSSASGTTGNAPLPEPFLRPNFNDLLDGEYQELCIYLPSILESLIATERNNWLKGASGAVEPVYIVEDIVLWFAKIPSIAIWVLRGGKGAKFWGTPVQNVPVRLSSSSAGSVWKLTNGWNMTIRVVLNRVEQAGVVASVISPIAGNASTDLTDLDKALDSAEGVTMLFWLDQIDN